jgi:hypothetical protein
LRDPKERKIQVRAMTEEDGYQNNATAALELPKRVRSNEAKDRLLKLADA